MELTKLQQVVINQLGIDVDDSEDCTLSDIANNSIADGFNGFIYYSDTVKFFDDNRELILTELNNDAREFGVNTSEMVSGFGCLSGNDWQHEIDSVLMGINCDDDTTIKNALAWYAGESVACQLSE